VRSSFDNLASASASGRERDHHVALTIARWRTSPQAWTRSRALDLNLESMAPEVAALQTAITPRTSALVIAHLFGTRAPMRPLIDVAKRHGLFVLRLRATFTGPDARATPKPTPLC